MNRPLSRAKLRTLTPGLRLHLPKGTLGNIETERQHQRRSSIAPTLARRLISVFDSYIRWRSSSSGAAEPAAHMRKNEGVSHAQSQKPLPVSRSDGAL